jgi:hypothetical protein
LKKHRSLTYMAWATIIFLTAVSVSVGVGHRQKWPERIDNGSIRDSAKRVLEKL